MSRSESSALRDDLIIGVTGVLGGLMSAEPEVHVDNAIELVDWLLGCYTVTEPTEEPVLGAASEFTPDFTPAETASPTWSVPLVEWLDRTDDAPLDFRGAAIPTRLRWLLEGRYPWEAIATLAAPGGERP